MTNKFGDDTNIIKQNINASYIECSQYIKDININTPNILCRYLFNNLFFNYPYLSPIKSFILNIIAKISRSDLIFFGQIEPINHNGTLHKTLKINTYLPSYDKDVNMYINKLNILFNKTSFCYSDTDEANGLKDLVEFMEFCSDIFLVLYYIESNNTIESFDIISELCKFFDTDTFDNDNNIRYKESLKNIIDYLLVNVSYSNISGLEYTSQETFIDLMIRICGKFLSLFDENDTDVLLTYQYFKMLKSQRDSNCSYGDFQKNIKGMLECCEKISYLDENHIAILANRAYLHLLTKDYEKSLELYDELFQLSNAKTRNTLAQIFEYYRDVPQNSYEYEFAKFAYAYYNYKKNSAPIAKQLAERDFKYLVNQGTDVFLINKSNEFLKTLNKGSTEV